MSAAETTLTKFFNWDEKSQIARIGSNLSSENEKLLAEISVPRELLKEKLIERIVELLNFPMKDFCLAAWKKHKELQEFADPEKYPPQEQNKVNLLEHEITADYHPVLEVSWNGKSFPKQTFDLGLSVRLEGCVLTIKGGRIEEVLPGTCQGKAVLKWKESVLAKAETSKTDLGNAIKLEKGVQISVDSAT